MAITHGRYSLVQAPFHRPGCQGLPLDTVKDGTVPRRKEEGHE